MRRSIPAALLLTLLLVSCSEPQPAPAPTENSSSPTEATILHAPEIRFALIGEPTDVNVWALYDEAGAGYNNYALRNEYWPRLYFLAPPDLTFTPRAANGMPTGFAPEGNFFVSSVSLRSDLKWTDGSPFTSEDVAFTVNSALAFELGFDWKAYYSPDYLVRAEAVDSSTVRFYFKQRPNIGVWQYGALQGPILQKAYWESKITGVSALLPDESLRDSISSARARIAELQPIVDELKLQLVGKENRELSNQLKSNQGNLDEANNSLAKLLAEYAAKIESAHQALYALDDSDEPTLGVWMPAKREQGQWVNLANSDFPFGAPNFDRVVYSSFDKEEHAIKAFEDSQVDAVLSPQIGNASTQTPSARNINLNGSARFLVFNPARSVLSDPALRQALACMIWSPTADDSVSFGGFVLPGNDFWRNPDAVSPCADLTGANLDLQWERAIQFLKSAGYSWSKEPTKDVPGSGLALPTGQPFPTVLLITPSKADDPLQADEAARIEMQAKHLGIPLMVEYVHPEDVRYAVFSSKNYDMAILGWRLSLYPGYLCEWFGAQGQFEYGEDNLKSECDALEVESDLEIARQHIFTIQSILTADLPLIPLYAAVAYDIYQNIRYPFEHVLGGFTTLYGAPSYAIPTP